MHMYIQVAALAPLALLCADQGGPTYSFCSHTMYAHVLRKAGSNGKRIEVSKPEYISA